MRREALLLACACAVVHACGASGDDGASSAAPAPRPVAQDHERAAGRAPETASSENDEDDDAVSPEEADATPEPYVPHEDDPIVAEHPIEDASGHGLDGLFRALARTEAGEEDAITRVVHMGDSSIGMDQLPHYLRSRFQARFGDAGTGFVLLQPHSTSYRNQTVDLSTPAPWDFCFIIFRCLRDGHYGLGGVAATSHGGATTLIRTHDDGERERTASRAELYYAAQPRGGRFELRVDRGEAVTIDARADELEDRFFETRFEPGPHSVRVRAAGGGPVRGYGIVLENDGPGVVWDTLSMIGAFTPRLLEQDEAHFREQLQHRDPDLVILGYGGNDLRRYAGRGVTADTLREETLALLTRVRTAVPDAGCLLTGIVEHEMSGRTEIGPAQVEAVVDAQRAAAREAGCAYFDLYEAMGGAGGFRRWLRQGLAADDLKHLSPAGRRIVAGWMYDALVSKYVSWRRAGGGA